MNSPERLGPAGPRGWNRRHRIYLCDDHLLLVGFDGFSENYRRFYLRDLQGLVVRRTSRRLWINLLFGLAAGLLLLPVVIPGSPTEVIVGFGIIALVPLAVVALNSVAGPTCSTVLQTAVQSTELPALRRVGDFERCLARIQPLILAAQAEQTSPAAGPAPVPPAAD